MNKVVIAAVIAATLLPVKAQLFSRESLGVAVLGGIAGGIIGHNSGRHTAEGIGIGAGVGLLLGALASDHRRTEYQGPYSPDSYPQEPTSAEGYPAYHSRPNYAVAGTIVGGIAGGVIGHNAGRHSAEGVAIGAGTGLIFGGIAEHEQRKREELASQQGVASAPVTSSPVTIVTNQVQTVEVQAVSQPAAIVGNDQSRRGSSAMSRANALFGR